MLLDHSLSLSGYVKILFLAVAVLVVLDQASAGNQTMKRREKGVRMGPIHRSLCGSEDRDGSDPMKSHIINMPYGFRSHHFMGNRWGNSGNSVRLYFWGAPKSLQMVTAAMKLKDACSLEEKL